MISNGHSHGRETGSKRMRMRWEQKAKRRIRKKRTRA
jgi:hypothetical protein